MKNLLTVVGDGNAASVLDTALMTAERFNSQIVGLHSLTTEYAVVFGGEMGFSISSEVDRTLEREGHERRDQARRLFREFMNSKGVPVGPVPPGHNGPSASWREEDGRQNAVVGMIGRVYDLIIVEQPEKLASIAEATLEDALFESGRPVLMVPKRSLPTLGEVVAIAWNASPEAARAVAGALPFLAAARAVHILSVGKEDESLSDAELACYLGWHGIVAVARNVAPVKGVKTGEALLAAARDQGADLLVMGGYGHAPWREMIFGGATRQIVGTSRLPILLAH